MGTIESARSLAAECEWVQAHAALTRLARERAAADAEEGRWLVRAFRAAVHVHLGHGSFAEYVERFFGYKSRTTQEKLRVAEALERLPELARALDAGEVGWCAVRELTRVAVPETEADWLAAARGKTIRQLEELVANKSPGDTPEGPTSVSRARGCCDSRWRPRPSRCFATPCASCDDRPAAGSMTMPCCSRWLARYWLDLATKVARRIKSRSPSAAPAAKAISSAAASSSPSGTRSWPWRNAMANTSVSCCRVPASERVEATPLRQPLPMTSKME
jgi:hypothetical protein